jgi:Protein of unknown function (DUF3990)
VWNNGPLELYHGTDTYHHPGPTTSGAEFKYLVDWSKLRDGTDFGKGFYTTPSVHQAREWANNGVRRVLAQHGTQSQAVVLMFRVDRNSLAALDVLGFVRATPDYYDLVNYCRNTTLAHPRMPTGGKKYDVVFGPVSLGKQRLVIYDSDQVSFHTTRSFGCLCNDNVEVNQVSTAANGEFKAGTP